MLRPSKKLVGVNVDTERNAVTECNEVNDEKHDVTQMETSEIEYNLASFDIKEVKLRGEHLCIPLKIIFYDIL